MLKIGSSYKDNKGRTRTIGGLVKENPSWVWTIDGDWFDQTTGSLISMDGRFRRFLLPPTSPGSISNHKEID